MALLVVSCVRRGAPPTAGADGGDDAAQDAPEGSLLPRGYDAVERVIDGDTIRVVHQGESVAVRYIGVNAPETGDEPEAYGPEASQENFTLVRGRPVRLEFDAELRDPFDRLLAYVYLEDGTFVNAAMVERGFARVLTIRPNTRHQELFERLEREAKAARRGMWQ